MAVAKSYENYKIIGEPYTINDKLYVRIIGNCKRCGGSGHYSMNAMGDTTCYRCGGSGKEKMEVRWYTDAERRALDRAAERREEKKKELHEKRRAANLPYNRFGFNTKGYITLLSGEFHTVLDFCHSLNGAAKFDDVFKWYLPQDDGIVIPENIKASKLYWSEIGNSETGDFTDRKKLVDTVYALTNIPSKSTHQGQIGDKLSFRAKCVKVHTCDTKFGISYLHTFEDEHGNIYIWFTSSKSLSEGEEYAITGKVKEHKEYNHIKQTVLNYVRIRV